jgi:hypothetical protein
MDHDGYAEALPLAERAYRLTRRDDLKPFDRGSAAYSVAKALVGLGEIERAIPYAREARDDLRRVPDMHPATLERVESFLQEQGE